MAKEKSKITKDMAIGEVAQKYPESVGLLLESGMHCVGCGMMAYETLEQGCKGHGMSDKDIDELIDKMNKASAKAKK